MLEVWHQTSSKLDLPPRHVYSGASHVKVDRCAQMLANTKGAYVKQYAGNFEELYQFGKVRVENQMSNEHQASHGKIGGRIIISRRR